MKQGNPLSLEESTTVLPPSQENRRNFWRELIVCLPALVIAVLFALWPLIQSPASDYPAGVDALGHLTKIKYLADSWKELRWPAWFPYWYNGSATIQYYPPLAYVIAALIQLFTNNVMVTFKGLLFLAQFGGALGVWFTCRRFIGPWAGLVGGILYAWQPYLLRSLLLSGVVAQATIYALTPWFVFVSLLLFQKTTPIRWLFNCALMGLLILAHPMHAFLVAIVTGTVILILVLERKIGLSEALSWLASVSLGAGLVSFWWLPGVTQLENPGIPFLLPEAAENYTATLAYFNPATRLGSGFYFGLSTLVFSCCALLFRKRGKACPFILSLVVALLLSVWMSFGRSFPFFNFIPLHQSLVPGRFLSISSLIGSLLGAVLVFELVQQFRSRRQRLFGVFLALVVLSVIALDINPSVMNAQKITQEETVLQKNLGMIPNNSDAFRTGRFSWILAVTSNITYFPMLSGLNMTDGWNIEGTPHNRVIWQHNIAIAAGFPDYVARDLLLWNTRSLFLDNRYDQLKDSLFQLGFQQLAADERKSILYNPAPSSYVMCQDQNAIAIGKSSLGLVISFPWMAQGHSVALEDYSPVELQHYQLVYLVEPEVRDWQKFENSIAMLAAAGKMVIVEMGKNGAWPLFGVNPYHGTSAGDSQLVPTITGPLAQMAKANVNPGREVVLMGNLDGVWMELQTSQTQDPVIGYKDVGGGKVCFVGMSISQQLISSLIYIQGQAAVDIKALEEQDRNTRAILEKLMDLAAPYKRITPRPFPATDFQWTHDSFSFSYQAEKATQALVSVTYAPRWKAKLDGQQSLPVYNQENLLLVDLPAGKHKIYFKYGMTWVGWSGIALSIFSLFMAVMVAMNLHRLDGFIKRQLLRLRKAVEAITD